MVYNYCILAFSNYNFFRKHKLLHFVSARFEFALDRIFVFNETSLDVLVCELHVILYSCGVSKRSGINVKKTPVQVPGEHVFETFRGTPIHGICNPFNDINIPRYSSKQT